MTEEELKDCHAAIGKAYLDVRNLGKRELELFGVLKSAREDVQRVMSGNISATDETVKRLPENLKAVAEEYLSVIRQKKEAEKVLGE